MWSLQSRREHGTVFEKLGVSEKHEMTIFDDFVFLRNARPRFRRIFSYFSRSLTHRVQLDTVLDLGVA